MSAPTDPTKPNRSSGAVRKRRQRRSALDRQIVAHVLRASSHQDQPQNASGIAEALHAPYSTVTAALRRLERAGRLVPTYVLNNFRTQYCHEFRVELTVEGREIVRTNQERHRRLAGRPGSFALRDGGSAELFIEELIADLAEKPEYGDHLIVRDAVCLHGASGRDVELSILTNDGPYSLGRWVRDQLIDNKCIRAVHTVTVGFRYSQNGYSGEHVNYEHAANGRAASGDS